MSEKTINQPLIIDYDGDHDFTFDDSLRVRLLIEYIKCDGRLPYQSSKEADELTMMFKATSRINISTIVYSDIDDMPRFEIGVKFRDGRNVVLIDTEDNMHKKAIKYFIDSNAHDKKDKERLAEMAIEEMGIDGVLGIDIAKEVNVDGTTYLIIY